MYPPSYTSGCTIFSLIYRHELVLWWYFNGYSRMVGLVKYILYLPQDHFYFYFFATETSRICRKTRLLNASFTAILNFHYQLRTVCGARLSAAAPLTTTHIPSPATNLQFHIAMTMTITNKNLSFASTLINGGGVEDKGNNCFTTCALFLSLFICWQSMHVNCSFISRLQ